MQTIHYSQIIIPDNRIRRDFSEKSIRDLADSIESKGLMHPIVLRYDFELNAVLVAGERRLRAMKLLAGEDREFTVVSDDETSMYQVPLGHVPYNLLSELDEIGILEAELEENAIRVDLSWQEHAEAIGRLHKLRKQQHAQWTISDTNKELYEDPDLPVGDQPHYPATRRMIILADNLTDELVRTAKDPSTAMKLLRKKTQENLSTTFAEYLESKGETESNQSSLLNCDGIEHMRNTPREYDVILADPPYGIEAQDFNNYGAPIKHEYEDSAEQYIDLIHKFAVASMNCTKPDAHLYLFLDIRHWEFTTSQLREVGWTVWPWPIIWGKRSHGLVPSEENGPARAHEMVLFARKGNLKVTHIRPDLVLFPIESDRIHAAQKPVALIRDLLARSLNPHEGKVLDPFVGSGTTITACREMKLEVVGCEIDDTMYKRALIRLVTEVKGDNDE